VNLAAFTVTACNDGPTALGHIDRGYRPDMVITDIHMPGMNGLQVIQHVRERLRFTPIVALNANKQAATRELGASGRLVNRLVTAFAQLASGSEAQFIAQTMQGHSPTLWRSS
jgi:CheY-like chemotaxis protein